MEKVIDKTEYVKKQIMIIVSLSTLVIGFLGGVFYCSFKHANDLRTSSQTDISGNSHSRSQAGTRIQDLKKILEQDPEKVEIWIELGNIFFDTDQYPQAIESYLKALDLRPEDANVWTDLGVMFRRNRQPQKAIESFNRAIEIDPDHEISRFNRGIVMLYDLNDKQGALQAWGELLEINPFAKAPNGKAVAEIYETVKKGQ